MKKVLVTGAAGFVGRAVTAKLVERGHMVVGTVRRASAPAAATEIEKVLGDINGATDWLSALDGVETVIHTASRVHVARPGANEQAIAHEINVLATEKLLADCRKAGVRRFIQLSTIGVYDPAAGITRALAESDPCRPETIYGATKLEAEALVSRFGAAAGAEALILRPPLIYGAGAPGNWGRLVRLAAHPIPLPFGAIRNRRTLLGRDNLSDAIAHLVARTSDPLRSGVYNIADDDVVSLAEILTATREGLGRPRRLLPVPARALGAALSLAGRAAEFDKFAGDLTVDGALFRTTFGWRPPERTLEGIARSARETRPHA